MMEVKDTQGKILREVPITEGAVKVDELMKQYSITLSWDAVSDDELPAGAYIEYEGVKYTLLAPYKPQQKDEIAYEYKPVFSHPVMRWQHLPFFHYTYSGSEISSKETDWSLTDNAANFMSAICAAINQQTGEKWTYSVASDLKASVSLSFSNTDIFSALASIAGAFETEWWFDYANKIVYLSKASHGTEVTLEVGNNIGIPSANQSKSDYATRFYVFGSTRNIDQGYTGSNTNNIVNKRLTLDPEKYPNGYIDIREGLTDSEILVKTLVFDDIYPRSSLAIADVKVRMMWRLDSDNQKVQIGTDSEGNPVYDQYAIWYFKIPSLSFNKDMVISGKALSVHFNSGSLNGREFELTYHDVAKKVSTSDGMDFQVEVGDFEINFIEEGTYIIPAINGLIPADGDKVTLFNITMPQEYMSSAYTELENKAKEAIVEQGNDKSNYSFSSNPVAFFGSNPSLSVGRKVLYKNGDYSYSTRVIKLETQLDRPFEQKITIGNEQIKGNTQTLKEEVVNANQNIDLLAQMNKSTEQLQMSYIRTQKMLQENIAKAASELAKLGLTVKEENGKKYLESAYDFYSKGGVASGQPSSDVPTPGGGGGSNVTVTPILTSGEKIATIKVNGVDSDIYAPKKPTYVSELENDAKYVTEDTLADTNTAVAALATTVGGLADTLATEQGYIDTLQGYFVNGVAKKATADALGNVITDTYATKVALNAVDERVKTLEALGLTLEVKDGVTYVKSKYSFYTLGGLASGEPSSSGGGGGTVGGSNVSFKAELLSGTKIGTITIDNVATNIYAPSALANPYALTFGSKTYDGSAARTITASDLGALSTEGGTISSATVPLTVNRTSNGGFALIAYMCEGIQVGNLGFNPNGDLVVRPQFQTNTNYYNIYHSGNFNPADYLSLSGGTMQGDIILPERKYLRDANNTAIFGYNTTQGVLVGSPSVKLSLRSGEDATLNGNTLIHSGNIGSYRAGDSEKLGGYSLGASGKTAAWNTIPFVANDGVMEIGKYIDFHNDNTSHDYSTRLLCTGKYSNSVSLPSASGTLALLTDNVASATKLQDNTAFTAWGQTFFENGAPKNISGYIYDVTRIDVKEWLELYAKDKTTIIGELGHLSSNNVHLRLYSNADLYLGQNGKSTIIKYNGNVLIGTTEDNGAKLRVGSGDICVDNTYGYNSLDVNGSSRTLMYLSAGNVLVIGNDNATLGNATYISGSEVRLRYGSSKDLGLLLNSSGNVVLTKALLPNTSITQNLGSYNLPWLSVYTDILTTGNGRALKFCTQDVERMRLGSAGTTFRPTTDNSLSLGDADYKWSELYTYYSNFYSQLRMHGQTAGDASIVFTRENANYIVFPSAGNLKFTVDYTGSAYQVMEIKSGQVTVTGNLEVTGGIASRQPSDARLKNNVQSITTKSAVDVLRALNPISFEWNTLAQSLDKRNEGWSVGFIAQDFEQLIPNSGSSIWGKYRAIDYTKAIPYLAKGWQINADNIEDLRVRVQRLEAENRELKQLLNRA